MAMFGDKSVLDMTADEFSEWKAAIQKQAEYEREFKAGTAAALASAKLRIAFFGVDAQSST